MSERAATVIPLPLSVVESNIWDVTSWTTFLGDVEWIERSAHERYVFGVRQGRRVNEVPVAVRWHARDHRVTWRELSGPAWRGEIRLTALNGRRTRIGLSVSAHPRGFLANLTDVLGGGRREVDVDLRKLAERMALLPQPFNPGRLGPSRRAVRQGTVRAARSVDYLASHVSDDQILQEVSAGAAGGDSADVF
jgi:hypothetical protein